MRKLKVLTLLLGAVLVMAACQGSEEATGSAGRTGCDPAYPTVCIQPKPPDLNCGDIPFKRFKVLPPDPHRFDGDKDGVGCES